MGGESPVRLAEIVDLLEAWAPRHLASPWDNVGLQLGEPGRPVRRVLVALDVEDEVVTEAETQGADLIVSHHPPIFRPLRALRGDAPDGALLLRLVRAGVAVYSAHTNLDRAPGGVNDVLCELLGLREVEALDPGADEEPGGLGRVGRLARAEQLQSFCVRVKRALDIPFLLSAGDPERSCRTVALCGGSGGSLVDRAVQAGADVYVTADLKYHQIQAALAGGACLVDPGHYASERPVLDAVVTRLRGRFAARGVEVRVAGRSLRFRSYWRIN